MDTTTLLIIIIIVLLVGGGGWYGGDAGSRAAANVFCFRPPARMGLVGEPTDYDARESVIVYRSIPLPGKSSSDRSCPGQPGLAGIIRSGFAGTHRLSKQGHTPNR